VHFDQDFFLPQPLSDDLTNASLVAYTSEFSQPKQQNIYIPNITNFLNTTLVLNSRVRNFCNNEPRMAYNAGIMGGDRTEIFEELWDLSFEIIKNNTHIFRQINCHFFNVVLEQFLFTCLARDNKIPVTCLENESSIMIESKYTDMKFFPFVSSVHVMANGKCASSSCVSIPEILKINFPDHYYLINKLLRYNLV
jgi:hypothetical protein